MSAFHHSPTYNANDTTLCFYRHIVLWWEHYSSQRSLAWLTLLRGKKRRGNSLKGKLFDGVFGRLAIVHNHPVVRELPRDGMDALEAHVDGVVVVGNHGKYKQSPAGCAQDHLAALHVVQVDLGTRKRPVSVFPGGGAAAGAAGGAETACVVVGAVDAALAGERRVRGERGARMRTEAPTLPGKSVYLGLERGSMDVYPLKKT